jgi:hypothetical protein
MPVGPNPSLDTTGECRGYGQSGPVFLMPGNWAGLVDGITCVVPEGMAIHVNVWGR